MQHTSSRRQSGHVIDLHSRLQSIETDLVERISSIIIEAASRIDPFPEMNFERKIPFGYSHSPSTMQSPGFFVSNIARTVKPVDNAQIRLDLTHLVATPSGLFECYVSIFHGLPIWEGKTGIEGMQGRNYIQIARLALEQIETRIDGSTDYRMHCVFEQ